MKTERQKVKRNSVSLAWVICVIGTVAGCSTLQSGSNKAKAMWVQPAPDAGFIEQPERLVRRMDLPIQKVWIKPGFEKSGYLELVVAPVNTQYMQEMGWLHRLSSANWLRDVNREIETLALHFEERVVKVFETDTNHRFQVIESPAQHKQPALRMELALIEINPSMPVLHALSWLGPLGTSAAAGVANQRRVAFEGRLCDLQTGEAVATFADRNMQDVGPIDMTRLTWYDPAKGVMDKWAVQFVQIANRTPGEVITNPVAFTLRPF